MNDNHALTSASTTPPVNICYKPCQVSLSAYSGEHNSLAFRKPHRLVSREAPHLSQRARGGASWHRTKNPFSLRSKAFLPGRPLVPLAEAGHFLHSSCRPHAFQTQTHTFLCPGRVRYKHDCFRAAFIAWRCSPAWRAAARDVACIIDAADSLMIEYRCDAQGKPLSITCPL